MCEGEENIDLEIEEQLTYLLADLYDKWNSCFTGIGTDEDKKEAFLYAIKGRIERGFSILKAPGRYSDEKEMERILGKLYRAWKKYMNYLGNDVTIDRFINMSRDLLCRIKKEGKWQNTDKD